MTRSLVQGGRRVGSRRGGLPILSAGALPFVTVLPLHGPLVLQNPESALYRRSARIIKKICNDISYKLYVTLYSYPLFLFVYNRTGNVGDLLEIAGFQLFTAHLRMHFCLFVTVRGQDSSLSMNLAVARMLTSFALASPLIIPIIYLM